MAGGTRCGGLRARCVQACGRGGLRDRCVPGEEWGGCRGRGGADTPRERAGARYQAMIDATLARRIKLVGLDVDGVLTDAGVYIGQIEGQRVEFKRFDIQDGLGVMLLRRAGIAVAIVSGRHSDATTLRARELNVDELVQDNDARKLPAFEAILTRRALDWDACAFVGDDLADLPVLKRVALPVAVANAVPDVHALARYVTRAMGGQGAVREVAEVILRARGDWDALVADYLKERGDAGQRVIGSR